MMPTRPGGFVTCLFALTILLWHVACCDIWQSGLPLAINNALPRAEMSSPHHRLLDIDDALVSEANPARNDGKLDVERCVRLHNYLAARAWMAKNRKGPDDLHELLERPSLFENYESIGRGDSPERIRNLLDPDMVKFLESAINLGMGGQEDPYLFLWVCCFAWPSGMADSMPNMFDDQPEVNGKPHFITLYVSNYEMGGHGIGVVYDQVRRQVSFPDVMESLDYVHPVEKHEDMWFPLEVMLSKWIDLIHMGKVVPQPISDDPQAAWDVWNWKSYTAGQVDSAVAAFDRLTAAIESRMPAGSLLALESESPLLTDAQLDAASVPQNCFVRSFLTKVRNPRFSTIAPGLEVPHDPVVFAQQQEFTIVPYRPGPHYGLGEIQYDPEDHVAPVLIFAATDKNRKVPLGRSYNFPFWYWLRSDNEPLGPVDLTPLPQVEFGMNLRGLYNWWFNSAKYKQVPAGVYSEIIDRTEVGEAEEGFHLLLPYSFRFDHGSFGPRQSDGSLVETRSSSELFQHGFWPFGGLIRAQRLERLLDRWRELVEEGVWTVGSTGVEGTIDTYKDAEWKNWKDYWIPPDW